MYLNYNWNPTISLEWLIISIADKLEPHILENIEVDNPLNGNTDYSFHPLEYNLINLAKLSGERPFNATLIDSIKIDYSKVSYKKDNKKTKYWKSGVGFGNDNTGSWDIKNYIKELGK